jgi:hypothetical protein
MADRPCYHDIAALHRYPASRGSVALDYNHTTMSRSCSTFGSVTFHTDDTRHDVFRDAPSDIAMHGDRCLLIHASNEIAGITAYVHFDRIVEPDRYVVYAIGIEDFNIAYMLGETAQYSSR